VMAQLLLLPLGRSTPMLRAQQLDGVDQSMSSETPDRQSDDGTEQIPDVREPKSSEAWHPVYLVTADEIPDQKLD